MYNPSLGGFGSLIGRNSIAPGESGGMTDDMWKRLGIPQLTQVPNDPSPMPAALQGAKPSAWGKGGKAWAILGVIGDALQATNGQQGTFMPQYLDLQKQTAEEKQRLAALQSQREALKGVGLSDAQVAAIQNDPSGKVLQALLERQKPEGPTTATREASEMVNWTPDQWQAYYRAHPGAPLPSGGTMPVRDTGTIAFDPAPIMQNATKTGRITAAEDAQIRGRLGENGSGSYDEWLRGNKVRVIKRTGKESGTGRTVYEYTDGSFDYGN